MDSPGNSVGQNGGVGARDRSAWRGNHPLHGLGNSAAQRLRPSPPPVAAQALNTYMAPKWFQLFRWFLRPPAPFRLPPVPF